MAYAYSNLGYCWLGRRVAQTSGESHEAAVRRLVPEAAGLSLDPGDVTVVHQGLQAGDLVPAFNLASGGWIGNAASYLAFATRPVHPATFTRRSGAVLRLGLADMGKAACACVDPLRRHAGCLFRRYPRGEWCCHHHVLQRPPGA